MVSVRTMSTDVCATRGKIRWGRTLANVEGEIGNLVAEECGQTFGVSFAFALCEPNAAPRLEVSKPIGKSPFVR